MPIIGRVQGLDALDEEAKDTVFLGVVSDLIGALATPGLLTLVDTLCSTVSVDAGNGKFETLSDESVAEELFSPDITLQIPVALTAAMINLDTLFDKMQAVN